MSDVQTTTPLEGAVASSAPQFDSFFSEHSVVDVPKRPEADPAAQQNVAQQSQQQTEVDQSDAQPDDDQAQGQDDAPQYQSLHDLLAAHKIDPESIKGLKVKAKIDGVEQDVPFSDVLASYQLQGHVNNKSVELSNQRTALEQERNAARTLFAQQLQQNQNLGNVAMQMLNHDFNRIDWNALRVQNPAEFAALQAEFQQRQQGIQQYIGALNQQAQQAAQQQQESMRAAITQEHEKLMAAVPEWRNAESFTKDKQAMTKYATSLGFQQAELDQIFDHRYMRVLHDAARYQELQAAAPDVLKKVRQAPPMAAPGSRQDVNPKEAQRRNAVERFNRNPHDPDAQAAAFEFFANQ